MLIVLDWMNYLKQTLYTWFTSLLLITYHKCFSCFQNSTPDRLGFWSRRDRLASCVVVGGCICKMWRKALAAALLALAVGFFYQGSIDLPDHILEYISLPNFKISSSSQSRNSQNSVEQVICTAWETLISLPSRRWSRVAVGYVHL